MNLLNTIVSLFKPETNVLARYYPSIKPIHLTMGPHCDTDETGEGCLMNVISYMQGDHDIVDTPSSVSPLLHGFGIVLNDYTVSDEERQGLIPLIPRFMLTGNWTKEQEQVAAYELYGFLDRFRQSHASANAKYDELHRTCALYNFVALGEQVDEFSFVQPVFLAFWNAAGTKLSKATLQDLRDTLDRVLPQIEPGVVEGVIRRHRLANEASLV